MGVINIASTMGSPLGPLLANVPAFYRPYVDDTLMIVPDVTAPISFLNTLNHAHDAVNFTMELETYGVHPFHGVNLINQSPRVETKVHVKPASTGLLLHHHSHVDNRYKNNNAQTCIPIILFLGALFGRIRVTKGGFVKIKIPSAINRLRHQTVYKQKDI